MILFEITILFCSTILFAFVGGQTCSKNWVDFNDACYKFTRTPLQTRDDAEDRCRAYNAHLVSVNNLEEHNFITGWLRENDPHHRSWYTSGRDAGDNVWVWDPDNDLFSDINTIFLPSQNTSFLRYVAYNYSTMANKWGLQKVDSVEPMAYICKIMKENLDHIIISEREIDYGVVVSDKEKVPKGPYFIQEPESVIFDPGSRKQLDYVLLKCVAGGYPPPTYKWYKEELKNELVNKVVDPLSDWRYTQTDGTLIISEPKLNTDQGNYHCTVENQYGLIISQTVQLSFGFIGEFNRKHSPVQGQKNRGKFLSCDPPQHYPKLNFYWARNHWPNLVEEDQRVFVSNDGNLYFSTLENVDEASYSCIVQSTISSSGRNGPFFNFTIEPASSYEKLSFPNNFPKTFPDVPVAGDDVRLECVAFGYPVPQYNWIRKGSSNELPKGAYTYSYNRIVILPKVEVEDAGDYVCTATNAHESINRVVAVRIQAKPKFTIPLANKVVDKNSNVIWTCEAFGKPDVSYTWLKNGKEIDVDNLEINDRNRYHIQQNILTIDKVVEDQGMYQCKATNHLGSAYSSAQLRVITLKPTFKKYPLVSKMFVIEGGNVTIPCDPEAAPFPEFSWKKDNLDIGSTERIQMLPNGYLHISPVKGEDKGQYTCIAENQYGKDSSDGLLIVLDLPRLVDVPNSVVQAVVNDSTELPCEADIENYMLDLTYAWVRNGLHKIDVEKEPKFSVGRLPGYLRIENITLAEAGIYHCIVKTAVGTISRSTQLVVLGPPGAPGAVLAEDLTATSGKIHWSDGSANGDPITAYAIEGKTNHNSTWVILKENITDFKNRPGKSGRREAELFNVLSPWSIYEFRVSAINGFGKGEASRSSPVYNTDKDLPRVPPANVGGGGGVTGSLTITWDPLTPEEWNDEKLWYNVSYKPANSDTKFKEISLKYRHNIGLHVVLVGEENFYNPYLVKVQAINSLGPGPYSEPVEIYSAENTPQVYPRRVYAFAINSTVLNVTWSPLELSRRWIRGKLIGYRFKYREFGKDADTDFQILYKRGLENWGLIDGLQPDTEYFVYVMPYNGAGGGIEGEAAIGRTFKAAPLRPPTKVRVEAINSSSISVAWRGVLPSSKEEPIKGYKVRYWESDRDMTSAKEVYNYTDGDDLKVEISGLSRGEVYKLVVLAFSDGGDGKMSSPVHEFKMRH